MSSRDTQVACDAYKIMETRLGLSVLRPFIITGTTTTDNYKRDIHRPMELL
ncbi:hypothetical protein M404DRAFT_999844, partial [Pisolithus tinctorius Marx 270]